MHMSPHSHFMYALLLGITAISVVPLGAVTERQKHTVRRWLALGLHWLRRVGFGRTPAAQATMTAFLNVVGCSRLSSGTLVK